MESITKPVIGIVFCGFSDDCLFVPFSYIQAIEKLLRIWKNTEEVQQMRKNNRARIKQYSLQKIDKIMENIYR